MEKEKGRLIGFIVNGSVVPVAQSVIHHGIAIIVDDDPYHDKAVWGTFTLYATREDAINHK